MQWTITVTGEKENSTEKEEDLVESTVEWRWGLNHRFFWTIMEEGVAGVKWRHDLKCSEEMEGLERGDSEA